MKQNLIIPYNLSQKIVAQGRLNPYATYFSLKTMYEGSRIHNYRHRLSELSKYTGVSSKTIKRHIAVLIEDGMASVNNGHLSLRSKDKLKEFFNLDIPRYFAHYITEKLTAKQIKYLIRTLIIKDSVANQQYKINNCKSRPMPSNASHKRSEDFIDNYGKIKNEVRLSQFTYAKKMGLKHASSGNYHFKQLMKNGYLYYYNTDPVFVCRGNSSTLVALREENPSYSYFMGRNYSIYRRLPNVIKFF